MGPRVSVFLVIAWQGYAPLDIFEMRTISILIQDNNIYSQSNFSEDTEPGHGLRNSDAGIHGDCLTV